MTLREAITVCKEMQMWRRRQGKYDGVDYSMPYTGKVYGEAIDVLISLAERQVEMEEEIQRFKRLCYGETV